MKCYGFRFPKKELILTQATINLECSNILGYFSVNILPFPWRNIFSSFYTKAYISKRSQVRVFKFYIKNVSFSTCINTNMHISYEMCPMISKVTEGRKSSFSLLRLFDPFKTLTYVLMDNFCPCFFLFFVFIDILTEKRTILRNLFNFILPCVEDGFYVLKNVPWSLHLISFETIASLGIGIYLIN